MVEVQAVNTTGKVSPIVPPREPTAVRRFELADLSRHNGWLYRKVLENFPRLENERSVDSFLRGIIYSNEFLFLYQEHSVALAQLVRPYGLEARKIVKEQFVFAEAPRYHQEAANFYKEFERWAKSKEADVIIVDEKTDVPPEMIKAQFPRLSERKETFVRL